MKLRLLQLFIFLGCACGQISYAAEAETAVAQSTEQKYSATFGENTVYFTTGQTAQFEVYGNELTMYLDGTEYIVASQR